MQKSNKREKGKEKRIIHVKPAQRKPGWEEASSLRICHHSCFLWLPFFSTSLFLEIPAALNLLLCERNLIITRRGRERDLACGKESGKEVDGMGWCFRLSQHPEIEPCPCLSLPPRSAPASPQETGQGRLCRCCPALTGPLVLAHAPSLPRAACPTDGLSQSHLHWAGLRSASPKRLPRPLVLGSSIKISGPVLKRGKSAGFPGVSEAARFMSSEVLSLLAQRFPGEEAALWSSPCTFLGILQWL